jgi:hypothetical protein
VKDEEPPIDAGVLDPFPEENMFLLLQGKEPSAKVQQHPPMIVSEGFGKMFDDILSLSDFIFKKNEISPNLQQVGEMARQGKIGPNDLPTVWLHRFGKAMEDELREFKESLAWKWWKPGTKTDIQNTRVEIVDLFHFVVTAAVVAGMTGKEFAEIVYEKRALNFKRQIEGFRSNDDRAIGADLLGSIPRPPDVQGQPCDSGTHQPPPAGAP